MPRPSVVSASRRLPALGILATLAWGCTTATPSEQITGFSRDLARLHLDPVSGLVAPDTVRAGVPFTVTGYGAGSGTLACNAPDGTDLVTTESTVRIVAYMRYPSSAVMMPCTKDYRMYPYAVSVQLSKAGPATVRFVGAREIVNGKATADSLVKRIVVLP